MLPLVRTVPAAGSPLPDSTFIKVVLPAPLRPTSPIRSPSATWNEASASSSRAPARSSMPLATIMWTPLQRDDGFVGYSALGFARAHALSAAPRPPVIRSVAACLQD